MILAEGRLYDTAEQDRILSRLEADINRTRQTKTLTAETVITAVERLGRRLAAGDFDTLLARFGIEGLDTYIKTLLPMLSREALELRVSTELGIHPFEERSVTPPFGQTPIFLRPMPLGTLLHIAAGNVDGLPAFSVVEGLLTGNVNLLKLPQADSGLSLEILQKLMELEPDIREFLYVFDTPSSDLGTLKRLADLADGIVVWGGETAVAAVRRFAPVGAKLIEWGHRLSFAYISGYEDEKRELAALARHIVSTKQLLCSSCQTIFLDTDSLEELGRFCRTFLPYLDAAAKQVPATIGETAERTLRRLNGRLERMLTGDDRPDNRVFQGRFCSLTASADRELELSDLFGNVLVKALPREQLFGQLRRHKGVLQTAGLICSPDRRAELTNLLSRGGLTRITRAGDMSAVFCGESHDGEFPLRRYIRTVVVE